MAKHPADRVSEFHVAFPNQDMLVDQIQSFRGQRRAHDRTGRKRFNYLVLGTASNFEWHAYDRASIEIGSDAVNPSRYENALPVRAGEKFTLWPLPDKPDLRIPRFLPNQRRDPVD
jgi:hypothetical protein